LGAFMTNIMPLIPASGSVFENMPQTNNKELNGLRKQCEVDIKQMYHCRQCRADAIGTLGEDQSAEFKGLGCGGCNSDKIGTIAVKPTSKETDYTFAVASRSGSTVDAHFGHVDEFHIYRYQNQDICLIARRKVQKYCAGSDECESEESKIKRIISAISDCDAVIVLRIGHHPSKLLESKGIHVIQTCGGIREAVVYAADIMKSRVQSVERAV